MKAAFFDVDGTLTKERIWMGLMEYFRLRRERRFIRTYFWVYHIPLYLSYRIGLIPQTRFRKPWAKHLAWFYRGYSVENAKEIWDWIAEEFLSSQWWEDSLELVSDHQSAGDLVMLVSASPKPILEGIADRIGVKHAIGTDSEIRDGRYTGGIRGPVCIAENKAKMTQQYLQDNNIEVDLSECYAYADSPGDSHLLEMVGHPFATHPDDELRVIAMERGWKILPN